MSDLKHLIDLVTKAVNAPTPRSDEEWQAWRAAGDRITRELREQHGARIRLDHDPATIIMGGVRSTATAGWASLLRNWAKAATNRLEKARNGSKFAAYADRRGVIGFCHIDIVPAETMVFAEGDDLDGLKGLVAARARHDRGNDLLLVPGVPEAINTDQALSALTAWTNWAFNSSPRFIEKVPS
ncbi:hypothetical protein [Devosia sp. DBB001]|nr:hypothetical protein [Devosia sp. DBB001]